MKKLKFIPKESESVRETSNVYEEDIALEDLDYIIKHVAIRMSGDFAGRAIWLHNSYDYIVGKDSNNNPILIPLKKNKCCE